MGIWELVSSLFGGGLVGLLGTVISKFFEYRTKKLDIELQAAKYANEIAMKRVEGELMAQEWAARTKVAEVEGHTKMDVADSEAFAASFNEPVRYSEGVSPTSAQGWLLILLDSFRAIIRPALTLYLCILTTLLYFDAHKLLRANDFTQSQAEALVLRIIETILFLTTTCVLWWFGTRNKQAAPQV